MQAAVSVKRIALNHIGGIVLLLGVVVSVGLVVATLAVTDTVPTSGGGEAVIARPVTAYTGVNQGEGLVGPTSRTAVSAPKAYYNPNGGEGLVGPQIPRMPAATSATMDRTDAIAELREDFGAAAMPDPGITGGTFRGIGLIAGGLFLPSMLADDRVVAYASCGQGEGLLDPGHSGENPCR
jgi:hypothetical protein